MTSQIVRYYAVVLGVVGLICSLGAFDFWWRSADPDAYAAAEAAFVSWWEAWWPALLAGVGVLALLVSVVLFVLAGRLRSAWELH